MTVVKTRENMISIITKKGQRSLIRRSEYKSTITAQQPGAEVPEHEVSDHLTLAQKWLGNVKPSLYRNR